jgi:hypothetical protein
MTSRENYERLVEVKRLDNILPKILGDLQEKKIFLKMDTQGYDVRCFQGSERCFNRIVAMQSEISMKPLYQGMTHYLDALECYEQAGFELVSLSVVTREGLAIQEMNCLMVHQHSDTIKRD